MSSWFDYPYLPAYERHLAKPWYQQNEDSRKWLVMKTLAGHLNDDPYMLSYTDLDRINNLKFDDTPFDGFLYRGLLNRNKDEIQAMNDHPSTQVSVDPYEMITGRRYNNGFNGTMKAMQNKSLASSPDSQEFFDHAVSVPDPQQFAVKDRVIRSHTYPLVENVHGYSAHPSYIQGALIRGQEDAEMEKLHQFYNLMMEQNPIQD